MRKRTQKGTLYKKDSWWYLRYSDFRVVDGQLQRKRLAKRLALLQGCSKRKAEDLATAFLESINHSHLPPEHAVTLVQFVETVYFPRIQQKARPSTLRGYRTIWRQLKPY